MVGLCRLCASLKKPNLLITITESRDICHKLQTCCQLHMQIHDTLPKSICQECLECLNVCYKFYIKVQEAQETLESLFPSPTIETDTETKTTTVRTHDGHRKPVKCIKKAHISSSKIKIENEACSEKLAAADENSGNVFTISNVASMSEDNDNDGYLREVYNILGMAKSDVSNDPITLSDEDHMVMYTESGGKEDPSDEQLQLMDQEEVEHHIEVETLEQDQSDIEFDKVVIMEAATEDEIELRENEDDKVADEKDDGHQNQTDIQKDFSTLPPSLQLSSWNSYIYICHTCDYKAKGFNDLSAHAQTEHSVDDVNKLQYRCYDCQRVIGHYNAFLNHVRLRHHPALKLRCDACDKLCDDYQKYANHRNSNCTEAYKFPNFLPCRQCCKSFHSAYGLQTHVKQQHSVQDTKETFQCTVCNKEFAQKRSLKAHEITHTQKRDFSCDFCDKQFYNKGNLETHLYTHVSDNLYKCHICQKSYKSDIILEKHQLLHTNVKPFKCAFCSRLFRTKIEQTTHERVHTGEMPLQCIHCEKRFRFRSALNAHLKVHSGVKAHACKYCPKTFIDMSNFKKHVRRKHYEEETSSHKKP